MRFSWVKTISVSEVREFISLPDLTHRQVRLQEGGIKWVIPLGY